MVLFASILQSFPKIHFRLRSHTIKVFLIDFNYFIKRFSKLYKKFNNINFITCMEAIKCTFSNISIMNMLWKIKLIK